MTGEILTDVGEGYRQDDTIRLKASGFDDDVFHFTMLDEKFSVKFHVDEVSAYVEYGSEWATFDDGVASLCNEHTDDPLPHWLFEELNHIEIHGGLRPMDEYETRYQLKENRGIKGRE